MKTITKQLGYCLIFAICISVFFICVGGLAHAIVDCLTVGWHLEHCF